MLKYILKRIAYALLTVYILITLTFFMMHAIPGDPFNNEKRITPQIKENLRKVYGLDKPLPVQYVKYLNNLLHGNLGISLAYRNRTVNEIIGRAFPVSANLGLRAITLGLIIGLFLGIVAALNHNKGWDYFTILIAIIGVSVPAFVIGALLQYFLGVKLKVLPVAQWKSFAHTIMPTFALSLGMIAQFARYMRSTMLDVIGQDYIKTAKAKGLAPHEIVWRHEIRNAILPVITLLGPMIAFIMTGSFVVETIFAVPGLGKFFVQSVNVYDYTMTLGITAFMGIFLVAMTLLVDIVYGFIDPRIKLE